MKLKGSERVGGKVLDRYGLDQISWHVWRKFLTKKSKEVWEEERERKIGRKKGRKEDRKEGRIEGRKQAMPRFPWSDLSSAVVLHSLPGSHRLKARQCLSFLIIQHDDWFSSPSLINKASGMPLSKKSLNYVGSRLQGTLYCSPYIRGILQIR